MSLLEELRKQREESKRLQREHMSNAFEWQTHADVEAKRIRDLDVAIAALAPPVVTDLKLEDFPEVPADLVVPPMPPLEDYEVFGLQHATGNGGNPDAISALTPPLQHKGGETEAAIPEGFTRWEGGDKSPVAEGVPVEIVFRSGGPVLIAYYNMHVMGAYTICSWRHNEEPDDIIAYRIISSSEADSGPRSEAPAGDARIEPPISTLQASSGEGETTVSELGAADVDGVDAQTAGATLPDGGQESPDLLQESRCSVAGCEIHGTPPIDATEPAAYSPVNNADEPVTKPEADVFYHGLQAEAEAKKDPVAKLFGAGGIFGKPKALAGEGA